MDTPIKHNDQIPIGRLLADINRLQACRLDQRMEQIGLYRSQAWLLLRLAEEDGLAHSELSTAMHISPAAASKLIRRLEQQGYLQRKTDPGDSRISRVYLQPEGRAVIERIFNVFYEFNQMITTDFTDEEVSCLRSYLARLYANLH